MTREGNFVLISILEFDLLLFLFGCFNGEWKVCKCNLEDNNTLSALFIVVKAGPVPQ